MELGLPKMHLLQPKVHLLQLGLPKMHRHPAGRQVRPQDCPMEQDCPLDYIPDCPMETLQDLILEILLAAKP